MLSTAIALAVVREVVRASSMYYRQLSVAWRQYRQFAEGLFLRRAAETRPTVDHPQFRNNFGDQFAVAKQAHD